MKQNEVKIGQRYRAWVSRRFVAVTVIGRSSRGTGKSHFEAVNEATGRRLTISARRLYPIDTQPILDDKGYIVGYGRLRV